MTALSSGSKQHVVTVDIGKKSCVLMRVLDRPIRQSVIINPHKAINLEMDGNLQISDQHFSVWMHRADKKIMIHHTFDLQSSVISEVDSKLISTNLKDDFAACLLVHPVYWREDRPEFIAKPKHRITRIPGYDQSCSSLFLAYAIFGNNNDVPDLSDSGLGSVIIRTSTCQVVMYYTFLNVPSFLRGSFIYSSTTADRINRTEEYHLIQPTERPVSEFQDHLDIMVGKSISSTWDWFIKGLYEHSDAPDSLKDEIANTFLFNTIAPLQTLKNIGIKKVATMRGWIDI